jgi:hypothetical protein
MDIAARSKSREIRESIVPKRGSTATKGPDYNACLGQFVLHHWNARAAASESQSLRRAMARLEHFTPSWHQPD